MRSTGHTARWGLLLTTIAMGAALVGTGLVGHLGALDSSKALIRARTLDIFHVVKRSMRHAGGEWEEALDEALLEMGEQGLRFVAVLERSGSPLASAGTPSSSLPLEPGFNWKPHRSREPVWVGARVLVVSPLPPKGKWGKKWHRWRQGPHGRKRPRL